jgi:hypothetical protein
MGLFRELRLRFRPPRIEDPDFGVLLFMYIPRAPERSYWEGEWLFLPTGTRVSISLPGTVDGPTAEGRAFYLALQGSFDRVMQSVRAPLDRVCREWLQRPLSADLWQDVKLSGFGIGDPGARPPAWEVSFETTGEQWLGITVPFLGDEAQDAIVDT